MVDLPVVGPGRSIGETSRIGQSTSVQQGQQTSNSYIPEYSQTPILQSIAQYAQQMAPQVYQWGMDQYNKNQGNIDTMMRNAMSYASPQRIASEMGKAEAGVQQGAEAGRLSAIKDLQSYGIDPSSGRYAALDTASRVMSGAAAAGAGNQQREATVAQGTQMQSAAQGLSEQNYQTGYGASQAMTGLLGTGMQLKYSPLGTTSSGTSSNIGQSTDVSSGFNESQQYPPGGSGSGSTVGGWGRTTAAGGTGPSTITSTGGNRIGYQAGGDVDEEPTTGGFVSQELSPSNGSATDDVDARLNAGEFVIPKDVAAWKGQEFFYKLMAQARKMRATAGQESGQDMGYQENGSANTGYQQGGAVPVDRPSAEAWGNAPMPNRGGYEDDGSAPGNWADENARRVKEQEDLKFRELFNAPSETEFSRNVEGLPGSGPRSPTRNYTYPTAVFGHKEGIY